MTASVTLAPSRMRDSTRTRPQSPSRVARLIWALSGLNLLVVVAVLLLVFVVSERWWVGTVVTYLPRAPWAVGALVLAVCGLFWHPPSLGVNLVALLLVLGPLMDFRSPWLSDAPSQSTTLPVTQSIKFLSANVQDFQPDFGQLLGEIHRLKPDVIVLQEARRQHPALDENFPDWHHLRRAGLWIGSRFPIREVHTCHTEAFNRTAGLVVAVETPEGEFMVACIHQMTARRGLVDITASELATGTAQASLQDFQLLRMAESTELREQIRTAVGDAPLIVAGDFNTPTSSSMFQASWGDLTSAFDVAGWGYGYTSPVKTHKFWLSHVPWARIDHILTSSAWRVEDCQVGTGQGSDHHLIYARLSR